MKMQKAPSGERLFILQPISKFDTPIISIFDNEAQVLWQTVKTLARATVQGVAA
jgi:ACT domain-containing protein